MKKIIRLSILMALLACVSGCTSLSHVSDTIPKQYQDAELEKLLDTKKVSISFTEAPLCCILMFLADLTEINFVFDMRFIHDRSVTLITIRMESMTLRNALDSIAKLSDTKWTVRYGAVLIQDAKVRKRDEKSPNKRIKTDQ